MTVTLNNANSASRNWNTAWTAYDAAQREFWEIYSRNPDDDDAHGPAVSKLSDATSTMLTTPAPDVKALRAKLNVLLSRENNEGAVWDYDLIAAGMSDVNRLLPD